MAETIKRKIIITSANAMQGVSAKSGKPYAMLNLEYLNAENLNPTTSQNSNGYSYGLPVNKAMLDYTQASEIIEAPALYEAEYLLSTDKDMKVVLLLTRIKYINGLCDSVKK
jgi:DNA-binding GntR family transcriptional regulator